MRARILLFLATCLLRFLAFTPYWLVSRVGAALGQLLYYLPSKRKRVVLTNLRLCFPAMSPAERSRLARATFGHVIRSFLERGLVWFGDANAITRLVQIDSAIDLSVTRTKPVIYLGFHFVGIEAGCVLYSTLYPIGSLYTPMSSPSFDAMAKRQRARFGTQMLPRANSVREALRMLRAGTPVMFAADMDFGPRDSVFVPFFGVATCTLTSISRLAKISGAVVVPFVTEVLPKYRGYKLTIFDALKDYPSGDAEADATRMNAFLETQVNKFPDQYYWVHKRFKHRPNGEASVY